MSLSPALVVAAVFGLGLSIVVPLVLRDWRVLRDYRQALQKALRGTALASGGFQASHAGRDYRLAVQVQRNGPTMIELQVPGAVPHETLICRRGALDAAAEGAGLVRRCQTGDAAFDARLWVTSDSTEFAAALLADRHRREQILRLCAAGVMSLNWSTEAQALIVVWHQHDATADDVALARGILAWVGAAGAAVLPKGPLANPPRQAAQGLGASQAHVIGAMAVFAFGAMAAMAVDAHYEPVDRSAALWVAAGLALPLSALWAACAWRAMRAQVYAHRWWLPLLPVMAVGTWVASYAVVVGVNGALDARPAAMLKSRIHALDRTPRGGTFDHFARIDSGEFRVRRSLFQR